MNNSTCSDFPLHFSRREFMHVGLIGGLGLTLGDFLRIKAHGAQKYYKTVEGPAKSVIHIYLPGEWLTKSHGTLNLMHPLEYRGPW